LLGKALPIFQFTRSAVASPALAPAKRPVRIKVDAASLRLFKMFIR
jgi:hypothetical protein